MSTIFRLKPEQSGLADRVLNKFIVYTPGDPAGIGPELIIRQAIAGLLLPTVVIADLALLQQTAEQLDVRCQFLSYDPDNTPITNQPGELVVLDEFKLKQPCILGEPDYRHSEYVINTLKRAAQGCLSGEFAGLITGPVSKEMINQSGIPFSGHTEFLQAEADVKQVVMMLACEQIKVALATTHLPLAAVPGAITKTGLSQVLKILHRSFVHTFNMPVPRITVCGLNPHSGEGGHLGHEEEEIIAPVLEECRSLGMNLVGPVPADSAFTPDRLKQTDVFLAMYHDQGLPVLKALGFHRSVNITLGLPFIRTSVDHGTAYHLAGKHIASLGSLEMAYIAMNELVSK